VALAQAEMALEPLTTLRSSRCEPELKSLAAEMKSDLLICIIIYRYTYIDAHIYIYMYYNITS
jgi:hypothetical protein